MKKAIIAFAASMILATPAMAADFGIAVGGGTSSSSSSAGAASQGSSGSVLLGVTGQQSSAAANSNGYGRTVINNNNTTSTSGHTSSTTQQGTSGSLGFAGSQNANLAEGLGSSNATGGLLGGWLFVTP